MYNTILINLGKLGLIVFVLGAIAYISICFYLFFRQKQFIFFPSRVIQLTPSDVGLPYEEIWLPISTPSGTLEKILCWWVPTESNSEERVIIDLHGNRNNMGANVPYAQKFRQMGLSVLLVDYRGFGRSTNRFPSEESVYEDVEAVWNYLVNKRQIKPENIYLFGHSLGGAIAINLAFNHPNIGGLIIESSFTNIIKMVDYKKKYRMFPINLLLNQRFDSLAKVPALKMPILFTHGTEDELIPPSMSEALFAAAAEPKQLLLVPGAGHNNVRQVGGTPYWDKLQQFLI